MPDDLETRRRRAIYRSQHRGTKEMDIILGRFAASRAGSFDAGMLDRFERLLSVADPELNAWIYDPARCVEHEFAPLIAAVRRFHGLDGAEDRTP